jgi:DNA-binding response OmpR family regulator
MHFNQAQLGPRRVLIVEDDPDSRASLGFLLARFGHQVETAATGPEGVRLGVSHPHDVAVIDLGLPGCDGFRVARSLRAAAGASITLIAYTAQDESDKRAQAQAAGFDTYLVKPRDLVGLLRWFDPQCSDDR